MPLESKMVTRGIATAQSQVEARNFEIRKNVLKYDDVMSRQRTVVYDERRRILAGENLDEQIQTFISDVIKGFVEDAATRGESDEWDLEALWAALKAEYPVSITPEDVLEEAGGLGLVTEEMLVRELLADARLAYQAREEQLGAEALRQLERRVLLSVLDRKWREHLYEMDYLKEGIGLRAMAQRDPLVEYQREGYQLFQIMNDAIKEETIGFLFNLEVSVEEDSPEEDGEEGAVEFIEDDDEEYAVTLGQSASSAEAVTARLAAAASAQEAAAKAQAKARTAAAKPGGKGPKLTGKGFDQPRAVPLQYSAPSEAGDGSTTTAGSAFSKKGAGRAAGAAVADDPAADGLTFPGTSRNAQCPCGSGKKYKLCHGRNEAA
ncbi:MAG: SEC-C domain-containing protein [Bifidobacteriaceae bacterium]|nr:SEC-C domain-containing protein [Bifidobacteriaceae bacterium]